MRKLLLLLGKPSAKVFLIGAISFSMIELAAIYPGAKALAANGSVTYTYDALGRIATASYDTGVFVIYSYDANGNRLSQTVNVNTTTLVWGSGNWGQTLW